MGKVFEGGRLEELVSFLVRERLGLYHACQYRDFVSYARLGGIPSRRLLSDRNLPFTPFATDDADHTNGVWDKVFANFADLGLGFAFGRGGVPNAYGPILLHIAPRALLEMDDVAVCLRSAGGRSFDRDAESLTSVEQVDRLFDAPHGRHRRRYVKPKPALRRDLHNPHAESPEISCTSPSQTIDLRHVSRVYVDPVLGDSFNLQRCVVKVLCEQERVPPIDVFSRRNWNGMGPVYSQLVDRIEQYQPAYSELRDPRELFRVLVRGTRTTYALSSWADRVEAKGLEYQLARFATYLFHGTIEPMRRETNPVLRKALRPYRIHVDEDAWTGPPHDHIGHGPDFDLGDHADDLDAGGWEHILDAPQWYYDRVDM